MNQVPGKHLVPTIFLCAVLSPAGVLADGQRDIHQYSISVDYSLSRLWVEARYASPVTSITARSGSAGKYLIDVRGCGRDQNIRMRNRRMMLPEAGTNCINYTVDLARAARHDRNYRILSDQNVIVSPSLWLWRPELTSRSEIRAQFKLPSDVTVSVPWKMLDSATQTYRLARSPESSDAIVMFGKLDLVNISVPGATLRVSLAKTDDNYDRERVLSWIRATANDVALTYGRFPNPSPQVVVVPLPSHDENPVPFGRVIRDGGETIQLFVNPGRPLSEFLDDWTATHEFSHLMLPYLDRKHRWISEGFAQYYQNVLLSRSGAYDNQRAWQKIYDGLERGRKSRPELSPNEAAEGGIRTGLMKIYWTGAAIALLADVELRRRSDGAESLDSVLGQLQTCCLPADRVWSGRELFRTLDGFIGEPLFMPLYKRYADTAGFPDTSEVFTQLGLAVDDGNVRVRRSGELEDIRDAITRTDPETALWRQRLAASNDN